MIRSRHLLCLLALFVLLPLSPASAYGKSSDELKLLMDSLQIALSEKSVYNELKEQKIQVIKNTLKNSTLDLEQEYLYYTSIADEYFKYQLDSAITYSRKALEAASEMQDTRKIILTDLNHSILYSMHGMFHEAEEVLRKYSSRNLPEEYLHEYYNAWLQYEDFRSYTNYFSNFERIRAYRDSVIMYSDTTTVEYAYISTRNFPAVERRPHLLEALKKTEKDTPMYAMVTTGLAASYRNEDIDLCKSYYIRSAIADLRSSIKENSSLYNLAMILYQEGDLKNAYKFVQSAFDDAIKAGIQFRVARTSAFFSLINENYQDMQDRNQERLTYTLYIMILLAMVLAAAITYILYQYRKINRIRQDLAVSNEELQELNSKLGQSNLRLGENNSLLQANNSIKVLYIGQFFNMCSSYIDKIGNYQKELLRSANNHNMDDLIKKLKSTSIVNDEVEALYAHFDNTFLSMYPSFVEELNALLRPEERILIKQDNTLNKELRIYALLILGITDTEKIASFLRCSISTIYNYRTRMRNKALDKDNFEDLVCMIGKPKD